ncbi:XRE family transcriptional regulator [Apilactobacillus timberlakei]|uniref:helix-turn-helix domain-containing protein n=1 Tax=Apilactobacillus timberlakei TaxID=2008380 RepID=UPI00112E13A9|nr:helix-turn-helix transcriptional regulator [Apilactobacillus timberlakei]TPR18467.1 XRE family transcriptional regulator [Apilactobacillus timberlakei]TPR20314.1 XRE family transcriptional regulator [Apilactobacillus timberlakei]TPR22077.1 XRE family transcriptional regulator [Apilactobacillus timberlakei]
MENRLREVRKSTGISLAKLSNELKAKENLNISADALAKYERGVREPKMDTWNKLAHYFNVNMTYLQGFSNIRNNDELNEDDFEDKRIYKRELENVQQDQMMQEWQQVKKTLFNDNKSGIADNEFNKVKQMFEQLGKDITNNDPGAKESFSEFTLLMSNMMTIYLEERNRNKKAKELASQILDDSFEIYDEDGKHIIK